MEKLGFNLWILLAQTVVFLLLILILRAVAYKPIMRVLQERQKRIQEALENAKKSEEIRAQAETERERILSEAQEEANHILMEARQEADRIRREILAKAESDAARIVKEAEENGQREFEKKLHGLREQIVSIAIAAAEHLLGETLDTEQHRRLIDSFLTGLRDEHIAVLSPEEINWLRQRNEAIPVTVISAVPLSEEEQQVVAAELRQYLGDNPEITYRVDPAILGGLILKIGDRLIDGSARTRLEGMRQALIEAA